MLNQLHQRLSAAFGEIESIISEYKQVIGKAICSSHMTNTVGPPPENSIDRLLIPKIEESTEEIIYSVKEAAAFLKVSKKTVYNMCKDGRLLKLDNYKSPKFIRWELEKAAKLVRNYAKKGRIR